MTKFAWGWAIFAVGTVLYHVGHYAEVPFLFGFGLPMIVWGLIFVNDDS